MRSSLIGAVIAAMGGWSPRLPVQYSTGKQPPKVRFISRTPAVDTGASPRATQRRATRNQRRSAFQNAVAVHGSARQARRVRAAMTHGGT